MQEDTYINNSNQGHQNSGVGWVGGDYFLNADYNENRVLPFLTAGSGDGSVWSQNPQLSLWPNIEFVI